MSTAPVPAPPDALQSWVKFTAAKTSQAFLQGWLDVVCAQFPSIGAAALLIKDRTGTSLVPAAVWPSAQHDFSHLGSIVDKCLKENRGLVEAVRDTLPAKCQLAYPIMVGDAVVGAVVAEVHAEPAVAASILKHMHWGLGWLVESFQRGSAEQALRQIGRAHV